MTLPPDLFLGLLANFTEGDAERLGARLQAEFDGDTDAMLAAAWSMGARAYCNVTLGRHICRICGCWELEACDGGCWWAEDDLCSTCAEMPEDPVFIASAGPSPHSQPPMPCLPPGDELFCLTPPWVHTHDQRVTELLAACNRWRDRALMAEARNR